jgi:hypothetical protein
MVASAVVIALAATITFTREKAAEESNNRRAKIIHEHVVSKRSINTCQDCSAARNRFLSSYST